MNKFWKNQKGAVTVMVTLLLIPSLLISGSGVDLARIFTAKSVMQDANQLAMNSVMTQYDAMLQDVYGLFALAATDDELNDLVTRYVNACIYGDQDPAQLGSLKLFYGSEVETAVSKKQNLGQVEVLRHQILEYAKYRAPVALADELLSRLKEFETLSKDSEVVREKMYMDEKIGHMQDTMKDLYQRIQDVNKCKSDETVLVQNINTMLDYINEQFGLMDGIRDDYESIYGSGELFEEEKLADCETKYDICLTNIRSIVGGYAIINTWKEGKMNDDGEWVPAKKESRLTLSKNFETLLQEGAATLDNYISKIDGMVTCCAQYDTEKGTLDDMITALQQKLDSGECSEALANEIRTDIEKYSALLEYEVEAMGQAVRTVDNEQIFALKDAIEAGTLRYGVVVNNVPDTTKSISLGQLKNLVNDISFELDAAIVEQTDHKNRDLGKLSYYADLTGSQYKYDILSTFYKFQDEKFSETKNPEFYNVLASVCNEADSKKTDTAEANIGKILKAVQEKLKGLNFIPQGAGYYGARLRGTADDQFGQSGDWSDPKNATTALNFAMDDVSSIGAIAAEALDGVVDKLLLVTYASEMFSCYTDPSTSSALAAGSDKGATEQTAPIRTSLSGIPINTQVNYFYQSELEFLFSGNSTSAEVNLAAVAGTLLLVRFVFNYVSTFMVDEVKLVISSIKTSCSVGGPIGTAIGIAIGELARVAFALGESVLDVVSLRCGEAVPIMKNNQNWSLSVTGFANMTAETLSEITLPEKNNSTGSGLTYFDYLRVFLLLKPEKTLAERVGKLIQYNMTNIKNSCYSANTLIYGKESVLGEQDLYQLLRCGTAFELSTKVQMNFMFLSMGVFQNGVEGVTPASAVDLTVVDYRGY